MGPVTNAKKNNLAGRCYVTALLVIIQLYPPPHQFRINPGSVIVLDHFFLDIEVILNILKATTSILYI